MHKNAMSRVETSDAIYNELKDRLNVVGEITTNEAWKISKRNYGTVSYVFRGIMEIMVCKGYAEKIVNGRWKILKANKL